MEIPRSRPSHKRKSPSSQWISPFPRLGGKFSAGGDSGALVVDALSRHPLGILFGGKGDTSFVTPLDRILERFDAYIPTA